MQRASWITSIGIVLLPLIFLPFTQQYYETPKWALISILALCSSVVYAWFLIKNPRTRLWYHKQESIAFALIALAGCISLFSPTTNTLMALTSPLGPITFLSLSLLMGTTPPLSIAHKRSVKLGLYIVGSILGLIALYEWLGMGKTLFSGISFLTDPLWTPTGATTATVVYLLITITFLTIDLIHSHLSEKETYAISLSILAILTMAVGLGITLWQAVPQFSSTILPIGSMWSITLEMLKHGNVAFTGVGSDNFITAFTMWRPIDNAATTLWNIRFTSGTTILFHLMITNGIIGLIGLLPLLYILRSPKRIVLLVAILCAPPSITALGVIAICLLLTHDPTKQTSISQSAPFINRSLSSILLLISSATLFLLIVVIRGEHFYALAIAASKQNDGTKTYMYLTQALRAFPANTTYRIMYSKTSLALANSLAEQLAQNGQSLSEADITKDQELIHKLIEQSVEQAKAAISKNPENILAWENLAIIYETIIPISQGADEWAHTAYVKALSLDPTNPAMYLHFGNVLVHEQKYDDAIRAFDQATILRPTYANGFYNLANVYKLKGDRNMEEEALTKTLSLLAPNSTDYAKVEAQLSKSARPPLSLPGQSELTLPQ